MQKNIILCSDGTGNSGGKGRGTNVWRIFNAIDLNGHKWDSTKTAQVAFHDDGVGTQSNVLLKVLGGALGLGLKRNIRQLYTFLVKNYDPGDRIFLFGFSRGAYTIRALGGLIAQVGVIDRRKYDDDHLQPLVKKAINLLRRNFQRTMFRRIFGENRNKSKKNRLEEDISEFRTEHCVADDEYAPEGLVDIAFVGVWDTVDAYGFPFDHLADIWHYAIYPFRFPDTKISSRIKRASHAISIDDERHTFHPVLWDEDENTVNRVNQVWFPGVHSNVGGGYPKDGLALVTLDWMMSEAVANDTEGKNRGMCLRFLDDDRRHIRDSANAYDKLYNSRSGVAVFYRYQPRNIGEICAKHGISKPNIHTSAFQRIRSSVESYGPGNLPVNFNVVGTRHSEEALDESEDQCNSLASCISKNMEMPLLKSVAPYVYLRRYLHYIFLGIVLAVLVMSSMLIDVDGSIDASPVRAGSASALQVFGIIPEWLFYFVVRPFFAQPLLTVAPVLGSLVVICIMGVDVRNKMHRTFVAFWRETFADVEKNTRPIISGNYTEPNDPKQRVDHTEESGNPAGV